MLRLHGWPECLGVPQAAGTERDSRPGCRLREMVYVQAEEGKWNGLARRHEPCRARPTLPQLDRDRSQDQQREKAQRRPRRRRHAARPPFEWWRRLRLPSSRRGQVYQIFAAPRAVSDGLGWEVVEKSVSALAREVKPTFQPPNSYNKRVAGNSQEIRFKDVLSGANSW